MTTKSGSKEISESIGEGYPNIPGASQFGSDSAESRNIPALGWGDVVLGRHKTNKFTNGAITPATFGPGTESIRTKELRSQDIETPLGEQRL